MPNEPQGLVVRRGVTSKRGKRPLHLVPEPAPALESARPLGSTVRDPMKLWAYISVGIIATVVCSWEGSGLVALAAEQADMSGRVTALAGAVLLLPLLVTGLFGLRAGYCPAGSFTHVWTGRVATQINSLLVGAYVVAAGGLSAVVMAG
ncbi:MAG: hypothetical protein OEY97_04170 [Nitrospirota bacterium]|nr:hypothetical protein [Nitrospirota bacterium]